ncbi:MAG: ATP-grasp domain protein [Candidatus Saccharibacteria bacterium]|nr:ATP-grasp domain protein [Candidatus Saccharibacteria bacterium]
MAHLNADVAILMPALTDLERHTERYGGLVNELAALSIKSFFAPQHVSFDSDAETFTSPYDINHKVLGETAFAPVVRDLTMPKERKPLYESGLMLVHHPALNDFLAHKTNMTLAAPEIQPATAIADASEVAGVLDTLPGNKLIVKPIRGMRSQGIAVGDKATLSKAAFEPGQYLVQEFIDTIGGIPEFGVQGIHNIRAISIGNKLIGAISRIGGTSNDLLLNDAYGVFIPPEDLPEGMQRISDTVHTVLAAQPGNGENIIAIDMMRGIGADGEQVDVLCEVNRRPQRISRYDTHDARNLNNDALLTIGGLWDSAEAALLVRQLEK